MKILLAMNPFKGTLSSGKAAEAAAGALGKIFKDSSRLILPVSDGGDGFIDCFRRVPGAKSIKLKVSGPVSKKVEAEYVLAGREAYIEIAEACGMKRLGNGRLRPLDASTVGVGELINDALGRGAKKIYLGLGGTASSDGGAGMARALGFGLKDRAGREIPPSVPGLLRLEKIESPKNLPKADFFAVTDVTNPLLGKYGSARTYGPQKGASPKQALLIEKALKNLSEKMKRFSGRETGKISGGGAAGGLGAGLNGLLGAKILDGSGFVAERLNLKRSIQAADLVVTGEGRLDDTTFSGKMPGLICRISRKRSKRLVFVTGRKKTEKRTVPRGCLVLELSRHFAMERSMAFPEKTLAKTLLLNSEKIKKFLA